MDALSRFRRIRFQIWGLASALSLTATKLYADYKSAIGQEATTELIIAIVGCLVALSQALTSWIKRREVKTRPSGAVAIVADPFFQSGTEKRLTQLETEANRDQEDFGALRTLVVGHSSQLVRLESGVQQDLREIRDKQDYIIRAIAGTNEAVQAIASVVRNIKADAK